MLNIAIKLTSLNVVMWLIDRRLLTLQVFTRPIIYGPIAGLILGDFKLGIIIGAELEAIFIGASTIGGVLPSDYSAATLITLAYVTQTGADIETALALAVPFGALVATFNNLRQPVFAGLQAFVAKTAVQGDGKKLYRTMLLVGVLNELFANIMLFASLAFGISVVQSFMDTLPVWLMNGISASSSMMAVVGYSMILSMMWSKELGCFFFVGYIMAKFVGLNSITIAILGISIAITIFMTDKKIEDSCVKRIETKKENVTEEDFF